MAKKEPIRNDYGYIADDDLGHRMIYLHLYTHNGEIEIDLDKLGTKRQIQRTSNKEINIAKSILKSEMGLFKNDTTVSYKTTSESFDYELDLGAFALDTHLTEKDSLLKHPVDSLRKDTLHKSKAVKKKKKKKKEDNFEEWDFDDEDYE